MFLKVRLRFIDIYKRNCSHTACAWRDRLQGPFTNTVRTPTAEDCLGNVRTRLNTFCRTLTSDVEQCFSNIEQCSMPTLLLTVSL